MVKGALDGGQTPALGKLFGGVHLAGGMGANGHRETKRFPRPVNVSPNGLPGTMFMKRVNPAGERPRRYPGILIKEVNELLSEVDPPPLPCFLLSYPELTLDRGGKRDNIPNP